MKGFRKFSQKIKKQNKILWAILTLFLLALLFVVLVQVDLEQKKQEKMLALVPFTVPVSQPAPYPLFTATFFPDVSAQSAIVLDSDTNIVLFEKNADLLFTPASTTKIMTAIIALSYYSPDAVLTVYNPYVEGSVVGLKQGEQVKFSDMLYGMLLPSGNDAAVAIAQNYPGGESAFVAAMNKKAEDLSLLHTHFVDPDGLSENDYTTAHDLSRLAAFALKNPAFAKVVGTKQYSFRSLNFGNSYTVGNLNVLLGSNNVTGVKTGFTSEAGQVLVTSQQYGGHTIIIVVMKSLDRFGDTQIILRAIENKINFVKLHP